MAKKLKGKEWYTLIAPKMFNEKEIGKTPASNPKILIGRKIEVHAINLIDDLSKYYLKFSFKIKEIKEKKAYTEFSGLECMRDYISKFIRYGIRRLDIIQDLETTDKKTLRVKSIVITSKKIKKIVELSLKTFIEDKVKNEVESNKMDDFIQRTTNDTVKKFIMNEGNKIYPIRMFEIRKIEVL